MRELGGNVMGIDETAIGVENGDGQVVWLVVVGDELAKLYRGDDVLYLEVTYRREHSPSSQAGKPHLFRLKYSTKNKVLSPR
ncbi:anthocyanidin 5,3-O-glucosyltransferase-like [Pyrus ussuriensis x Pyrus communis]|uniref:Anthocyanidin 5,3-O-glucosyltransferase-like n=1 Tax=Pyrus ussuriensis x Pyrus communis TaxID=2448454 RepID=A0A5N5I1A5_9ROSA|nr:anthocyanidin 5,3-O-glucosyltransferase-like [Pyrus ussuriensis x Pyrus communis]